MLNLVEKGMIDMARKYDKEMLAKGLSPKLRPDSTHSGPEVKVKDGPIRPCMSANESFNSKVCHNERRGNSDEKLEKRRSECEIGELAREVGGLGFQFFNRFPVLRCRNETDRNHSGRKRDWKQSPSQLVENGSCRNPATGQPPQVVEIPITGRRSCRNLTKMPESRKRKMPKSQSQSTDDKTSARPLLWWTNKKAVAPSFSIFYLRSTSPPVTFCSPLLAGASPVFRTTDAIVAADDSSNCHLPEDSSNSHPPHDRNKAPLAPTQEALSLPTVAAAISPTPPSISDARISTVKYQTFQRIDKKSKLPAIKQITGTIGRACRNEPNVAKQVLKMFKKQTVFLLQTADVWTTSSSAELCICGPQTADLGKNQEKEGEYGKLQERELISKKFKVWR
ncbi:hypothetical protein LXL04_026872 [Taraxacum kok-saghyz]